MLSVGVGRTHILLCWLLARDHPQFLACGPLGSSSPRLLSSVWSRERKGVGEPACNLTSAVSLCCLVFCAWEARPRLVSGARWFLSARTQAYFKGSGVSLFGLLRRRPLSAGDTGSVLGWKIPWRRARQSTPVFLPGESQWTEEPGRLQSMGCKESDKTEDALYRCTVHSLYIKLHSSWHWPVGIKCGYF